MRTITITCRRFAESEEEHSRKPEMLVLKFVFDVSVHGG